MHPFVLCLVRYAVVLLAVQLTACTIVRPLPPVQDDLYFKPIDLPQLAEDCSKPNPSLRKCRKPKDEIDKYFGNLGEEIWNTDLQRHEYVHLAREKTNLSNLFNAALWPLGAYIGVRTIADPSPSLMRNAGALALATYGVLNSGIPVRDKLYLEASRRLACAITFASARLYAKSDIIDLPNNSEPPQWETRIRAPGLGLPTLQETSKTLSGARNDYEKALKALLPKLKSTGKGTEASSVDIDRRRRSLYPEGGGTGTSGASNITAFSEHARIRLRIADDRVGKLDRLSNELLSAGDTLRTRTSSVRNQLNQALISNAPSLTDPAEAFTKVTEALNKIVAANTLKTSETSKDSTKKATLQAGQPEWELSERTTAGLTRDSAGALKQFVNESEEKLDSAIAHASRWIDQDKARTDEASKIAKESNCVAPLFDSSGTLPLPESPATSSAQGAPK